MRRGHVVGTRLSDEELDAISFAARVRGVTVATLLRSEALRVARLMLRLATEPESPTAPSTETTGKAAPIGA